MATAALSAVETAIGATVTFVSSAQTFVTRAFLPAIGGGGIAAGTPIRFSATAAGAIVLLDLAGRRVGVCPAESQCVAIPLETDTWVVVPLASVPAAHIADLAAITGGEAPTEAEHNAVRTALNSVLAALRAQGILKAE